MCLTVDLYTWIQCTQGQKSVSAPLLLEFWVSWATSCGCCKQNQVFLSGWAITPSSYRCWVLRIILCVAQCLCGPFLGTLKDQLCLVVLGMPMAFFLQYSCLGKGLLSETGTPPRTVSQMLSYLSFWAAHPKFAQAGLSAYVQILSAPALSPQCFCYRQEKLIVGMCLVCSVWMRVLPTCLYVHHMHTWGPQRPDRKGVWIP